ncbi:unnamed protein product [Cyprideis torosa]|uniref:Large ribosomal subunit protein uL23m n=1 Tax=Cyprideis torosa TaxID=163714 RepID=A0A7R8WED6_9CRUS|nr:unnamed protein product [Cyprideis torosa]CAG0892770.1 unnamed protein product [Cyprideis torosa]
MSFRFYPRFSPGNPQLRIFLPNFWLKLVKSPYPQPPNVVCFHAPLEMTRWDVHNYLTKIYKVPVATVTTRVAQGKSRVNERGWVVKDDDYKIAYVTMQKGFVFQYPDLFGEKKEGEVDKVEKEYEQSQGETQKKMDQLWDRHGVPTWFGV